MSSLRTSSLTTRLLCRHFDVLSMALLVIIFVAFPELDLMVSRLFFDPASMEWIWRDHPVNVSLYGVFRYLPYWLLPVLLIMAGVSCWKGSRLKAQRPVWLFLVLTLLIGPGLLVHNVFKEGFERPRPKQVQEFGGESGFSPAFVISDQCATRCKSFVSGHAAMGFYLMVFAWVTRRRAWLWAGIALGSVLSLVRLSQGGHFLSDTIFAGFLCYFVYRLLSAWLFGYSRIREDPADE